MKEKLRSEIGRQDKWNLEDIYENKEKVLEEISRIETKLTELKPYVGHILDCVSSLYAFLSLDSDIDRDLSILYVYAHMKCDEDMGNEENQIIKGKVDLLATKLGEATSFAIPELLKADFSLIETYMKEEPRLEAYRYPLWTIYRKKEHYLSTEEEAILSRLGDVFGNHDETASLLRNHDLDFGTIQNEEGIEVPLTNSSYSSLIESKDRNVRQKTFQKFYEIYGQFASSIASTLASNIKEDDAIAKIRHYKSTRHMYLSNGNIDEAIYDNLIEVVHRHLDLLYRFFDLKKEYLGLDELHLYDIYVPMSNQEEKKTYTFLEAKEMVLNALSILGDEYVETLKKAFDEHWIDIYPNKGKKSGAYSWGSYGTHPYILLNFQGRLDDVSTLAHELGHSMHSYFSNQKQPYQTSSYTIFVAEVASTVNELLFYHYLLEHSNDKEEKMRILSELLELFKGTIYRQTMFAEFEDNIHKLSFEGETLTGETMSNLYYDLNKLYFGENVIVDSEVRYEWERISHFYSSYYVYQYATGLSAACYIADGILNHKEGALDHYLEFLTLGGSMDPVEELKVAGVDLTKPEVVESALLMFEHYLDEFKNMM